MSIRMGALSSDVRFEGFDADDFAAYERSKWKSKAFTLARRRVKDRLLALARAVASELSESLGSLELGASDEAPTVSNGRQVEAQWAFFTRGPEARSRLKSLLNRTDLQSGAGLFDIAIQHQHACLDLRVDENGFSIGFELATKAEVDRRNLREKLRHGWAKEEFKILCAGLPERSHIGPTNQSIPASSLSPSELASWCDALKSQPEPFRAAIDLEKDHSLLGSAELIPHVSDQMKAFIPLFDFSAWSQDNDHAGVRETLDKKENTPKSSAFEPGARVIILAGLFAGRAGYVAEVDPKGRTKVMVGPVSVSVDVKDLKTS